MQRPWPAYASPLTSVSIQRLALLDLLQRVLLLDFWLLWNGRDQSLGHLAEEHDLCSLIRRGVHVWPDPVLNPMRLSTAPARSARAIFLTGAFWAIQLAWLAAAVFMGAVMDMPGVALLIWVALLLVGFAAGRHLIGSAAMRLHWERRKKETSKETCWPVAGLFWRERLRLSRARLQGGLSSILGGRHDGGG